MRKICGAKKWCPEKRWGRKITKFYFYSLASLRFVNQFSYFYEKAYNESVAERRMEWVFSLELKTSRPLGNWMIKGADHHNQNQTSNRSKCIPISGAGFIFSKFGFLLLPAPILMSNVLSLSPLSDLAILPHTTRHPPSYYSQNPTPGRLIASLFIVSGHGDTSLAGIAAPAVTIILQALLIIPVST